ncbi:MAG: hypothetical protein M3304_00120, partial [Actinomycetota bacterium]|nr:hypothetical protein [Actinomycetota bacterium]
VDHPGRSAEHDLPRAWNGERRTLPERPAVLVDDPPRRDERAWSEIRDERAGEPERDDFAPGDREPGAEPDSRGARTSLPGGPLLDRECAGED